MLDHVSLGTHDLDRAVAFYTAVLAPFGYALQRCDDNEAAFGTATDWVFFLYPLTPTDHAPGARTHVAFRAASRADVPARTQPRWHWVRKRFANRRPVPNSVPIISARCCAMRTATSSK
jgi:catechol 2,3-dioxygenase-like lactoylglutathione lyase family enzyme